MKLSTAEIRDLFDYKPLTGELVWRASRGRARAGSVAGHQNKTGYIRILVHSNAYSAHRLVWQWVYGTPPENVIHHKSEDKSNRIWDLEGITTRANLSIERTSRSGLPVGVQKTGARFRSAIREGKRNRYLGTFDTVEEASAAYQSVLKGFSVL